MVKLKVGTFQNSMMALKTNNIWKLYSFIFVMRRFMTALVLVSLRNINIWARCIIFSYVQFWALVYASIIRPFSDIKDNIIEVMNETIFLILCIIVTVWNKKSMWFKGLPNILIIALMINGFMISFVLTIDLIVKCVYKWKQNKKHHNKDIEVEEENKSEIHSVHQAKITKIIDCSANGKNID